MLNVHPPSTLSGGGITSYTFNTLGYDKKNFILDANLQVPIALGGKRWGLNTIHVIPQFVVRIFDDDPNVPIVPYGDRSLPVRTPSAMPGIAYYFSPKRWWNPDRTWDRLIVRENRKQNIKDSTVGDNRYFGFYAFHHSNGQDGPEVANDSVNIYNGNFGEQVVFEFIYGQQRNFVPPGDVILKNNRRDRVIKRIAKKPTKTPEVFLKGSNGMQLNWRISLEWHPYALSNEVFRDLSQLGGYPKHSRMIGRMRLNGRVSLHLIPSLIEFIGGKDEWCLITPAANYERWRFMTNFSYTLDQDYYRGSTISSIEKINSFNASRRLNLSVSAYYVLKRSKYAALFAETGYYGSDPYNIYFNDSLWQVKFGFAFGFFDQPQEPDRLTN
jgi:hypothetical protein